MLTAENLQRLLNGKTVPSGRASTHLGSAVLPALARGCNKPNCRFQSWWTGSSLLKAVTVCSKRAACYGEGSPVASTSRADGSFLRCPLLSTN